MVILPLKCKDCGRRIDIRLNEPMPICVDCFGKMAPAGPVRDEKEELKATPLSWNS